MQRRVVCSCKFSLPVSLFRFPFGWPLAFTILHLASDCWSVVQLHAARAAFLALPPWPPPLTQLLPRTESPGSRQPAAGDANGHGRMRRWVRAADTAWWPNEKSQRRAINCSASPITMQGKRIFILRLLLLLLLVHADAFNDRQQQRTRTPSQRSCNECSKWSIERAVLNAILKQSDRTSYNYLWSAFC
ncbi:uncharacterized protein LOC116803964 [Drosophila mojavensis]|uniref:uncharacterized protein LOC116803964 n=1 Tax=Drosophila mojavensis TaxID=7230 RepID=UPI0013EEAA91|nr:uncharacterized protein LOC116803964 [Drosophila mojavensis]